MMDKENKSKIPNPQDAKKGCALIIGLVVVVSIVFFSTCGGEGAKPEVVLTKEQIHKQNVDNLFSDYDGSLPALTERVIQSLNDPNSFEHVETKWIDKWEELQVVMTFTAKNGYGGRLKSEVVVKCDTLGNITKVIKWLD